MSRIIRTAEGETVDLVVWREYGSIPGAVEAVLEANPNLAAQGARLPAGLTILLPDLETPPGETLVRLWG